MSNQFKWTDELVQKFVEIITTETNKDFVRIYTSDKMNEFKSYNTLESNLQKEKDAIELGELQPRTLAPEPKDFEIVAYSGNGIYKKGEPMFDYAAYAYKENMGALIYSVKRLSDGEVFSVGESTTSDARYLYEPIKRFFIKEGVMYAKFDEGRGRNDGCLGLNALQKLPPKPLPVKLFTTEDGVDIFEGDKFWFVWHKEPAKGQVVYCPYSSYGEKCNKDESYAFESAKYFSIESAANEYILINKPCLSVNDIAALWCIDHKFKEQLKFLAQSKQSNNK